MYKRQASNYFVNVVNTRSRYVWFGAHDSANFPQSGNSASSSLNFATVNIAGFITTAFDGGVDSSALTPSEYLVGYNLFSDAALADVSIIVGPDLPQDLEGVTVANAIIAICEGRRDVVCTLSPPAGANTSLDIIEFFAATTASTYAIKDSGRIIMYDKYNDKNIEVPACGSVAGLMADTDRTRGPWFSPAGFRRGQIRNVTRLLFNPNEADRDALYKVCLLYTSPSPRD